MCTTGALPRISKFCLPAIASLALVASLMVAPAHLQAAKSVTIGGPWTLIANDGTTVTNRTYLGKWLLVFFGYTSCPNTCPATLHEVSIALEKLGPEAAQVQPLFITVDPEHDTAGVVNEYVSSFDQRIVGLTGDTKQIAAAAKEYGVYYVVRTAGAANEPRIIDHSSYIYSMDPRGTFVRGFDANTSGEHIANTLRELMMQAR